MDTSRSIFLIIGLFLIFLTFYIAKKSFKFSKYKNIEESDNCSELVLLLNNNNKWIYDKHNICYATYCYKMKIVSILGTLWGDKVSMLTHIYPHKPWREIKVTICKITRLTAHFVCGLMSDLLICTCL